MKGPYLRAQMTAPTGGSRQTALVVPYRRLSAYVRGCAVSVPHAPVLVLVCALMLGAAGWSGPVQAAERTLARFLPEDTLLYFAVEDVTHYRQSLDAGALGALLAEPQVRAFGMHLFGTLEKRTLHLRRELGLVGWEIADLFPGQLALAVTDVHQVRRSEEYETPDGTRETYAYDETVATFVLLGEVSGRRKPLEELLAGVTQRLTAPPAGYRRQDLKYETGDVVLLQQPDSFGIVCYSLSDDLLAISNDLAALREVLALHHNPGQGDLSAADGFRATVAALGREQSTDFYFNWTRVLAMLKGGLPPEELPAFDSLGLGSVRAVGGIASPFQNGSMLTTFVATTPLLQGLAGTFDVWPLPFKSLTAAGPDTLYFHAAHVKPATFYRELVKFMARPENKDLAAVYRRLDDFQKQVGIDLQSDLFDLLGTETAVIFSVREPFTPDSPIDIVLLFQVNDPRKFQDKLKDLMRVLPFLPQTVEQEIEGYPVHVVDERERPCYAVAEDFFVISSTETEMRAVLHRLRTKENTLADNDEFRKRLDLLGPGPIAVSWLDLPRLIGYLYGSALPGIRDLVDDDVQELLSPEVLPPAAVFQKHLFPVTAAVFRRPDGFLVKTFSP